MRLIDLGKDRAVVNFNSNFYSDESITAGLTEFWPNFQNRFNFAALIGQRPRYFTVTLLPKKGKGFDRAKALDFCNFVLKREIESKSDCAQAGGR